MGKALWAQDSRKIGSEESKLFTQALRVLNNKSPSISNTTVEKYWKSSHMFYVKLKASDTWNRQTVPDFGVQIDEAFESMFCPCKREWIMNCSSMGGKQADPAQTLCEVKIVDSSWLHRKAWSMVHLALLKGTVGFAHMPCFTATPPHIFTVFLLFFCIWAPIMQSVPDDSGFLRLPSDGFINVDESEGVCARFTKPASCPVNCFRTEPVCGVNGVTYWCGCADAFCAGTRVAKLGFCEVGSGGSTSFSGQVLLLVHIVWLILLGFSVLCGLF
ncbi:hypothetical protein Goklo_022981 [Gossypium klotzschianum]|uniref:Kazal-like domain-containing protein n=1 Tax=Gossypium klotzschianum TaxID=34286 RepID=A0A7J8TPB8_9ROSI|nr:hypothetical protein [Gossypium klotzschianum]